MICYTVRGQVALADEAIRIGPPPAVDSYLRGDVILEAAKRSGAQASTHAIIWCTHCTSFD